MGFSKKIVREKFSRRLNEADEKNGKIISHFFISPAKSVEDPGSVAVILETLIQELYSEIPENERIGKGSVYISKAAAPAMLKYLRKNAEQTGKKFLSRLPSRIEMLIIYGIENNLKHLNNLMLSLVAEWCFGFPDFADEILNKLVNWIDLGDWEFKEQCVYPVFMCLKKKPGYILKKLMLLAESESENVRRLAAESLRPRSGIKWLRNPSKNAGVLKILHKLRADPSIYVRKSVGNNLKDLSKYMPEKVIATAESWIKDANIKISDDLASKSRKELGDFNFRLIWTIKHGLRWLVKRSPEYKNKIAGILGKNYVLYYDEKKNIGAKPPN